MFWSNERRVLVLGVTLMFISYVIYSAVIPVFPEQAALCGMTPVHIGVVIGTFPIGMFASSLTIGRFLPTLGAKTALIMGLVFAGIGALFFGSVPFFLCDPTFAPSSFYFFVLGRLIQGAAAGVIETTVLYSMSVKFSDNLGEMVAYQETAIGLALMTGPLVGGGIYAGVGFFFTFVVLCAMQMTMLGFIIAFFPKILSPAEETEQLLEKDIEVKLSSAMGVSTWTTFAVIFICGFLFNSQEVVIPVFLEEEAGWDPLLTGLLFSASSLVYAVFAIFVGRYLDQRENKTTHIYKFSFSIGFAFMAAGFYVIGPFPFAHVTTPSLITGVCLIGAGFAFCLTPSLPDAQLCAEVNSGSKRREYQSFMSSLWLAFLSASAAVGSPFIGFLYDEMGFSITMYVYAGISFIMAILTAAYAAFGPE